MRFQYGIRIAPPTRSSEDDDNWSYSNWEQDPFDDGHYYAPDDELDGGYCSSSDYFWFENNGYDGGGDGGYDDSYDPDGDNGYNDWIDDYGNHHQDDRDQNQQDDKKGDFGNQQEKKTLDTKKAKAEFKGFVSEKTAEKLGIEPRNCFVVAKSVMASFGQNWVHGSSETNYQITLIRSENGTGVPVTGSIPDAIQYITSRIDGNGPVLVGIDYNGDGLNDHWFVIYGYWQNSNTTIEFLYAETGTGNVGYAFSETNILSYTIGDDYISGPHWLFPDKYENHVRQVRINP